MDWMIHTLLRLSFSASFLMLAVFALRLLLKRAPKWIVVCLWALVAVRLVCPFSLESSLSLVPRAEAVTQTVVQPGAVQATVQPTASPAALSDFFTDRLLFAVWAVGAAAMLLYAAVSFIRLALQLRVSVQDSEKVYLCDALKNPFIFGVFRPRVYLPSDIAEPQKSYILRHEFAHLSRGDQFWKPLGFVILSVYWFHPLVWVSYILLCRDIELACDERVARGLSLAEKKAYSETLLLCSTRTRHIAAYPLAFAEVGVKARVKSVLRCKKPLVSIVALSCVAVLAVGICFLTEPKAESVSVEAEISENEKLPEPVTEPITEVVTEPITEPTTEPATEEKTIAEPSTQKKTSKKATTEAQTEKTTESNKPRVMPIEPPEPPTIVYPDPAYTQSGYDGAPVDLTPGHGGNNSYIPETTREYPNSLVPVPTVSAFY